MVSVQASRFSLLKIDDDFDEEKLNGDSVITKKSQNDSQKGRKKNKKKKKTVDETQELRNIAFGGGSANKGAKARPKSSASTNGKSKVAPEDWDLWKKQDEQFIQDSYETDLHKGILESQQLQFEQQAQVMKEQILSSIQNGKQKKKKKPSKVPMTLDEFKQMQLEEKKQQDSSDEEMPPAEPSLTTKVLNPDPNYFKGVSDEVLKILQKEKIQEKYKKQYAVENVRTQKFQDEIEKRGKDVKTLSEENKSLRDELKQVKKRNQQLCVILGQGEMKEKHKILMELEDLKQVRDELTTEVAYLNTQLQKERSKSSQSNKSDNSKSKGAKHK